MRQDYVSMFNKLLVIGFIVLVGVFLLWLAVGGTTVRSEARLDIDRLSNHPEAVTMSEKLQHAGGYRLLQVTAQVQTDEQTAVNPQGYTQGLGLVQPINSRQIQDTLDGRALQSQGESDISNLRLVQE